jgi:hypothetical protein
VSFETRWLLAEWHAHEGDTTRLQQLGSALLADSAARGLPLREALAGYLALARADTAAATRSFRALRINVPSVALEWGLAQPLAAERLLRAKVADERRDYVEADRIAGAFDHSSPIVFLPFLPDALSIRLRAARAMGRADLARQLEARLRRLGGDNVIASLRTVWWRSFL